LRDGDENAVVLIADDHFHHGCNTSRGALKKRQSAGAASCGCAFGASCDNKITFGEEHIFGAGGVPVSGGDEISDVPVQSVGNLLRGGGRERS
jgi:hypothetical protein